MIRVTALYPNKPDANFDFDYYLNKHAKMFVEKLAPFGFVKAEIDRGIGGIQPGSPPYVHSIQFDRGFSEVLRGTWRRDYG